MEGVVAGVEMDFIRSDWKRNLYLATYIGTSRLDVRWFNNEKYKMCCRWMKGVWENKKEICITNRQAATQQKVQRPLR